MPDGYRRLTADATGQHGAFTRRQAAAAGIGSAELRDRVQSGLLVPTGVRTLRSSLAPTSAVAEVHALVLDIGDPCWVSGPTAAALHRFDSFGLRRPYHVTVPRGRNLRRHGAKIHTTDTIDPIDTGDVDGIPVFTPVRTIVDLAKSLDRARLTTVIDGALRDGLVSEDLLHRRIVALRTKGRYGLPLLLDALEGGEISRGGHSWLERRFLELVATAKLPRPRPQVILTRRRDRLVRVDFHFEEADIVAEVLGYRWHRSQAQMRVDAERANALALSGRACIQFVYRMLVDDPGYVVATLRSAFDRSA